MKHWRIPALAIGVTAMTWLLLAACGDHGATPSTATAVGATPAATATKTSTPAASANTAPATPNDDWTVDPLGAGGTDPVTVKANPENQTGAVLLKDVRMGVHPELGGWDRIVFEFSGAARPAATIEYVSSAAQCGSGAPVTVKGSAILAVRVSGAAAHDEAGQPAFAKKELPGPGTTILEAKAACDFEGVVAWAVGIKAKQPFKVTTLQNPTRLVIDVKQ